MNDQIASALRDLQNYINNTTLITDDTSSALSLFVFFVQWTAIILSTVAGSYDARARGMDIYGSLVIGFIVSLGGGTVRDVLLGRYPIFWIAEPVYVGTFLVTAVVIFLSVDAPKRAKSYVDKVVEPVSRLAQEQSKFFIIVDALALGLWAYLGTVFALQMGTAPIVAPIMGIVTASFGGVLRDVLFTRIPQTFLPSQLYASAAAVGAVAYVILWWLGAGETTSFLVCFGLTFLIRIASLRYNIRSK
ncbi:MAG: TRIC cation channel family protein [Caldilinea sp.]|nr:TRIC cation channel family protein [Caldilinea sp.]MCB0052432.1 TRIC cation channel family protein [Caldilinea sp.]MCB0148194.1 TRIC cation channel family protein [Caldilineaceae bacterium]MCB9117820.1 TRIC cation channel family protein [Caldilineaceae bacterium]MCO5212190.1 TRIC cation channel family protein [Caldilinea sp.]